MMGFDETSYRIRNFNETLEILNKYKQLAGITRLADITNLDYTGIPVFTAIRPRAKSLSTSQGKGLSINAAKCSALMEAIEVHFAENLCPEIVNKSIYDLNKNNIPHISPNNLNNVIIYNDDRENMSWITTNAVISRRPVLAPFTEFSLNSYLPDVLLYSPNTTGLSGGNTYEEALLHSLLEIIERELTDIELNVTITHNELWKKISNYFDCRVIYKKNSYEIPSFEVLIKSKNPFDNQALFEGSGCHLDKNIALNRAITEAVQSRVTIIAGSRDDIINSKYDTQDINWNMNTEYCNFNEISDYPINDIESGINLLFEKIVKLEQDIIVFKYHEEEICVLKSKILPTSFIHNV